MNAPNPFEALHLYRDRKVVNEVQTMTEDGKARRNAKLVHRKKGDPQTPNMNFAGKISWMVRMLTSLRLAGYVSQLRAHPARENLSSMDRIKLHRLEERALDIDRAASELAVEIAAFNKAKKLKKMES